MTDERRLILLNKNFEAYLDDPPKMWMWAYNPKVKPRFPALPRENYDIIGVPFIENPLAKGVSTAMGHVIIFNRVADEAKYGLELLCYLGELPLVGETKERFVVYLDELRLPTIDEYLEANTLEEEIKQYVEVSKTIYPENARTNSD